jgi:hypothetical protein
MRKPLTAARKEQLRKIREKAGIGEYAPKGAAFKRKTMRSSSKSEESPSGITWVPAIPR